MTDGLNRRSFLTATAAAGLSPLAIGAMPQKPAGAKSPVIVASGNGFPYLDEAMESIRGGADPLDAAIELVAHVEADPNDHSVGYGGVPNEDGVVELDSAVMHGPTHSAGAVASIRDIMHPAAVARLVMRRTKHVLLVGEGAKRFALAHGFKEENLLTDEARQIWLRAKEQQGGYWVPAPPEEVAANIRAEATDLTTGTIHVSALDTHGDLGCVTTTSGWGMKIPGRVGDSPILGAGLYLDNAVGSCGSTGLGEINLLNCASYLIVDEMRRGKQVKDALVAALKHIADVTSRNPRYRGEGGRPNYGVTFYAVSKDGQYAGANMVGGASMAVHDGNEAKMVDCVPIFE
ncbi:N(4)-(beta-N-acetylglucosaminyl)-L-asparaginase [Tautonia plasticadhaerens]|uniref:N(4)-(Beta-N-acetylglucosaminyl)-L-asparaginase n=1 Tax=Tautonia plasticadhaerens TaxID=2527974 RepID=A0A518HBW3_9BACT|nr:N(4)-(beta-N-acetylglucosaminyl)-L-asparaginase [Tautonia plasticadhaerens]QDV38348.1 N(4)-(Beta-N-acetylglucosaminyl)-L-asparaginase precursor [Tautonia plasticadhaerens]